MTGVTFSTITVYCPHCTYFFENDVIGYVDTAFDEDATYLRLAEFEVTDKHNCSDFYE